MAGPRRKKSTTQKPLGTEGIRVSKQIIAGQTMEIQRLQTELAKIKNPIQRRLLTEQIALEKQNLARFKQKTK